MNKDIFYSYHPVVNFAYFAFVLAFGMTLRHPVMQAVSLLCAFCYAVQIEGKKAVLFSLKYSLPLCVLTALINPAFNHAGVTMLCDLPSGNPLTAESILYGLSAGLMLAAMLLWFRNFSRVITGDKLMYLLGKIIPVLSLVLSMTMRFIPLLKRQFQVVKAAQKGLGRDTENGSLLSRMKNSITVFSITLTWALENAIESADSMKSRGYGLKGRSSFTVYRFLQKDRTALALILFFGFDILTGCLAGGTAFRFFPSIRSAPVTALNVSFQIAYLLLCGMPVILNIKEQKKWTRFPSET